MSRVRKSVVTFPPQESDSNHNAPLNDRETNHPYLKYLLDLADRLLNPQVLDDNNSEPA